MTTSRFNTNQQVEVNLDLKEIATSLLSGEYVQIKMKDGTFLAMYLDSFDSRCWIGVSHLGPTANPDDVIKESTIHCALLALPSYLTVFLGDGYLVF